MEKKKQNLKNIYDVINKIARNHREKGEEVDDWFFTKEEYEELKKDENNKFL